MISEQILILNGEKTNHSYTTTFEAENDADAATHAFSMYMLANNSAYNQRNSSCCLIYVDYTLCDSEENMIPNITASDVSYSVYLLDKQEMSLQSQKTDKPTVSIVMNSNFIDWYSEVLDSKFYYTPFFRFFESELDQEEI